MYQTSLKRDTLKCVLWWYSWLEIYQWLKALIWNKNTRSWHIPSYNYLCLQPVSSEASRRVEKAKYLGDWADWAVYNLVWICTQTHELPVKCWWLARWDQGSHCCETEEPISLQCWLTVEDSSSVVRAHVGQLTAAHNSSSRSSTSPDLSRPLYACGVHHVYRQTNIHACKTQNQARQFSKKSQGHMSFQASSGLYLQAYPEHLWEVVLPQQRKPGLISPGCAEQGTN